MHYMNENGSRRWVVLRVRSIDNVWPLKWLLSCSIQESIQAGVCFTKINFSFCLVLFKFRIHWGCIYNYYKRTRLLWSELTRWYNRKKNVILMDCNGCTAKRRLWFHLVFLRWQKNIDFKKKPQWRNFR